MCGRYENQINKDELDAIFSQYIAKLHIDYDIDEVFKDENIAPTDRIKTIVLEEGVFKLKSMKWGIRSKVFDPSRQSKGKDSYFEKDIFNSRVETISKAKDWKGVFEKNRCLIPMTAFYEWPVINGKKIPQRISIKEQKCFFTGGIYKEDISGVISASVITCEPNTFIKSLHDRMPLIFPPDQAGDFLNLPFEGISSITKPLDDSIVMKNEVSELIMKEVKENEKRKLEKLKEKDNEKALKKKNKKTTTQNYDLFGM